MAVMNIPFQSYRLLKEWYRTYHNSGEDSFHNKRVLVYYEGMRLWLESMPATIRIHDHPMPSSEQVVEHTTVQFELPLGDGTSSLVYLMTLVTPHFATCEKPILGEDDFDCSIQLSDLDDPFGRPTVIWDTPSLSREEVLKAVRAWSTRFWPDFECDFVFERDREESPVGAKCRVLLQCDEGEVEGIQAWAIERNCTNVWVSQNQMMLLDGFLVTLLASLTSEWPDLFFFDFGSGTSSRLLKD